MLEKSPPHVWFDGNRGSRPVFCRGLDLRKAYCGVNDGGCGSLMLILGGWGSHYARRITTAVVSFSRVLTKRGFSLKR